MSRILQIGTWRAGEGRTWPGLHNTPLSSAPASPVPSAWKASMYPTAQAISANTDACLPPLSDSVSLQENKYFPTAAGGSFKNTSAKSLPSPVLHLSRLLWPQGLCTCSALHQECPCPRSLYAWLLLLILHSVNSYLFQQATPSQHPILLSYSSSPAEILLFLALSVPFRQWAGTPQQGWVHSRCFRSDRMKHRIQSRGRPGLGPPGIAFT